MNIASLYGNEELRHAEALHHYQQALSLRRWPERLAAQAEYNSALCLHAAERLMDARLAVLRSQETSCATRVSLLSHCALLCLTVPYYAVLCLTVSYCA